jgi:hypothetical protein
VVHLSPTTSDDRATGHTVFTDFSERFIFISRVTF